MSLDLVLKGKKATEKCERDFLFQQTVAHDEI